MPGMPGMQSYRHDLRMRFVRGTCNHIRIMTIHLCLLQIIDSTIYLFIYSFIHSFINEIESEKTRSMYLLSSGPRPTRYTGLMLCILS